MFYNLKSLSKKSLIVSPPSEVDCDNNEDASAKIFRLFLSHYGFLSLSNRHNLQPLSITENLLKDLSKFDKLPEYVNPTHKLFSLTYSTLSLFNPPPPCLLLKQRRECFGISVYYCKSGLDTINELLLPKSIPADFPRFLHTLAWPVNHFLYFAG